MYNNMMIYVVKASAPKSSYITTFYIETNDFSVIPVRIQQRTGEWYTILSAELTQGVPIEANS